MFEFGYAEEEKLGKPYDLGLLKRLYPYARVYGRYFLAAIALVIMITLFELAIPYITKIVIDRYIVPQTVIGTEGEKNRFLSADPDDPKIQSAMARYPDLFEIKEGSARIAYEDLQHLDKKTLALLRSDDLKGVAAAAAIFLMVIICSFLFTFIEVMVMEYTGQRIMHDLRMQLYDHIQSLNVSFFNRHPVGRLVTRVTNDIQNMYELFTSVIAFVFKDFFLLVGIAAVLISINWKLALISFTVLPVVIWAAFIFADKARDVFRVLRVKVAEINTRFSETIGGIKVIQVFGQERNNHRGFARLNHENYEAGMHQIRIFAIFMPVIELLGAVATAIVIFYGGGRVISEAITLGSLVAFISYMRMFFRPIRDIAEKYNILQNAMASAERIFQILDSKERLPEVSGAPDHPFAKETIRSLRFDDVRFGYLPKEIVLKGIDFTLNAGQTLAIVGPTGSGKTSMINLLTRFYDPNSGRIEINGEDIRNLPIPLLRSKMALVTQDPYLFSGPIRENIFPPTEEWSAPGIDDVLNASNARSVIDRLPQGLETDLSEGGASLSSGERQLLSIARAFARDPDLIILDEATSYIDSETEARIQDALIKLMKNRTSVMVAHRLSTARYADRIMVLHRGRIIESGSHEALMEKKGFYYQLNQLQNG